MIKIKHIAHACFLIDNGKEKLIIDPYDHSIGYDKVEETVEYILISHDHHDHNYIQNIKLNDNVGSFVFRKVHSYHDDEQGKLRGENIIHIIQTGNTTICHLGDLGHVLTSDQVEQIGKVDVLLIPVGGTYTIDYKQAVEVVKQINPNTVIPMHYKTEKTHLDISTVDNFIKAIGKEYRVKVYDTNQVNDVNVSRKIVYVI